MSRKVNRIRLEYIVIDFVPDVNDKCVCVFVCLAHLMTQLLLPNVLYIFIAATVFTISAILHDTQ